MKSSVSRRTMQFGVLFLVSLSIASMGWADARDQAKRIHDRIAGVPPSDATLTSMASAISSSNAVGAALMAKTST